MKKIIRHISQVFFIAAMPIFSWSQNPEGFDKMAKKMAEKSVPIIQSKQVNSLVTKGENIVFFDAREKNEYQVSHIKNSKFVGYDNFSMSSVVDIPKNQMIVVYCSVGYRSGKIGAKLREAGYTSVFNLYGGIFDWANNGFEIYQEKKIVKKVHPYNSKWGKWLKPELRN
ncbi:MAG: rhodanese-like domain-containing protein [Flavobacteriales bacterium]